MPLRFSKMKCMFAALTWKTSNLDWHRLEICLLTSCVISLRMETHWKYCRFNRSCYAMLAEWYTCKINPSLYLEFLMYKERVPCSCCLSKFHFAYTLVWNIFGSTCDLSSLLHQRLRASVWVAINPFFMIGENCISRHVLL